MVGATIDDIAFSSGKVLGGLLQSGRIKARDIVEANLVQIRQLDGTLHAFIHVDEEGARRAADEIDREIAHAGWRGGLHGLTVAIKDVLDVAGMRTTHGARAYASSEPVKTDCDAVARLRRAGAIIIGKTNTPPYASYINTTSIYAGTTVSPWDTTKSSGGSSGGSAVAVSTGMCVIALGTDLGGSVRGPAAWNGCYGLRPTSGRISNEPHGWVDDRADVIGPIARSPEDIRSALAAIQCLIPVDEPRLGSAPARFAFSLDFDGRLKVAGAIRSVVARAVEQLRRAGFEVVERSPEVDDALRAITPTRALRALITLPANASDMLAQDNPLLYAFLQTAGSLSVEEIAAGGRARSAAWRANDRFFDDIDALIVPATQFLGIDADKDRPETIDGVAVESVLEACSVTYAISMLGWPSLAVPCGRTTNGMPVGLQLVGPRGSESKLLDIATLLEERLGWAAIRPPVERLRRH